jgi:elongation factor Ts
MDKNLLSKLRKETGFGFSKCREALVLNENNFSAAEAWLHEQAEKEGWAKATKLQGRTASEGLVSVMVEDGDINLAVMVEVGSIFQLFSFFIPSSFPLIGTYFLFDS